MWAWKPGLYYLSKYISLHYFKIVLPIEVTTSIPMDIKTQDKVIINNPYILYIPTTTKSYNRSHIGHIVQSYTGCGL